jgi:hypothetical protein
MGFVLMGISIYLLLFDSEWLKKYLEGLGFLPNIMFFITLGLQIFLGLGVLILLQTSFQQFTITLMITSERTIARFGLFFKQQIEIWHTQFEHIEVKQSLLGKIFSFGTVKIRGSRGGKGIGGIKIQVSNVSSAKQFENRLKRIIKQVHYHKI